MAYDSWNEAVTEIEQSLVGVTPKQLEIARIAGVNLPQGMPRLVGSAVLLTALADELGFAGAAPVLDIQRELLLELCAGAEAPDPADRREADAWIEFLRLNQRRASLQRLQLSTGDIVRFTTPAGKVVAEVSSIRGDGRVYFKGGMGASSWPDLLSLAARQGDSSDAAQAFRKAARNDAALRASTGRWSPAKQTDLQDYKVEGSLHEDLITELEEVVDSATNERPIQHFLAQHPQLLTALLGGFTRFCVPQPRFGAEYVPDFLVADVNSLGIRWILVELETPISGVTLRREGALEQHTRQGVNQVNTWREWLQNNLDYARRSKRESGLGLKDIRPQSEGLVLVGRRAELNDNADRARQPERERSNIRIHTYDWLIEQLWGLLRFIGPPASNPYVIHRK